MQEPPKPTVLNAFRWLLVAMGRRGINAAAIATLFIAATGFLANQPALLLGNIVDMLAGTTDPDGARQSISGLILLIIACLIGVELFTVVRKYLIERISVAVQKSAFMSQVEQLFALRVTALHGMRTGELAIHLSRCVEGLVKLLKVIFMELVPSIAYAIIAIYFSFAAHMLTGFVMMGVVFVATGFTTWQILSQEGIRRSLETSRGNLGGVVGELTSALGYIRAAGLAPGQTARLEDAAEGLKKTEMRHHNYMMAFDAAKKLTENAGLVLVIMSGLYLFRTGELQAGGVLTLVLLYRNAALPLEKMHKVIDEGQEAVIRIGMLDVLRMQPRDPGLAGTVIPTASDMVPLIRFSDYHLKIGEATQTSAAATLSVDALSIPRGEVIGIAGESGSGKSTFIQAAMGLFPDATGRAEFLGCDIGEVDKMWLAGQIAYTPQRPFIIAGSLRDNVLLNLDPASRAAISNAQVCEALQLAGVELLPNERLRDLDLVISESGRNLSDGQCQRIGLARVFLSDAALVVLDEATSALDTLTERRVIENLSTHVTGKTVLMIAHRLMTLSWADRVLIFEKGKVIQDDTFERLSRIDGRFKQLLNPLAAIPDLVAAE